MSEQKSIDIMNCPTRRNNGHLCHCTPKCRRCHRGPHVSLHGPLFGSPVGSPPYDHEYRPEQKEQS